MTWRNGGLYDGTCPLSNPTKYNIVGEQIILIPYVYISDIDPHIYSLGPSSIT